MNPIAARTLLRGAAAALILTTGAALAAETDAAAQASGSSDEGQIESHHIQGNIWLMTGEPGMSNVVVQLGGQGILVVDAGTRPMADKLVDSIHALAADKTTADGVPLIRWVVDTGSSADHIGGNDVVAAAGRTVVAGNFTRDAQSQGLLNAATIIANVNLLAHLVAYNAQTGRDHQVTLPEDAIDSDIYNTWFNGEAVQLYHPHSAVSDDSTMVMFRRSDVIATGDIVDETSYPHIDTASGGTIDGELVALNHIIEQAVPEDKEQGGTMIIPGHGRLADQADVVYYKNVMTTIRNRVQYYKNQGKTLQQVLSIKPSWDWDGRWGHDSGPWTTDNFITVIYKTLPAKGPSFSMQNQTVVPADAKVSGQVF